MTVRLYPCPMCGRATFGLGCGKAQVHGDRRSTDLLRDPATPIDVVQQMLPIARHREIVALASRKVHAPETRRAAMDSLAWYWFSPEVKRARAEGTDISPRTHAHITRPARGPYGRSTT